MAHRILVIDDDEIALLSLTETLEAAGFGVESLVSPIGATQVILKSNIQLAVVDVNMPVMRGDRLVKLLRSWERLKELPVILVSGAEASTLAGIARSLPGVRVLSKGEVDRRLVPMAREALADRSPGLARPSPLPRSNQDLHGAFLTQARARFGEVRRLWDAIEGGSPGRARELQGLLHTIKGQAQLLGVPLIPDLVTELGRVADGVGAGRFEPARVGTVVRHVMGRLERLDSTDLTGGRLAQEGLLERIRAAGRA